MDTDNRESHLLKRLERIKELEAEILEREKAMHDREKTRKQILLRLSPTLWAQIASWADDEFRSINSQIEFILNEAVKHRHD